MIQLLDCTLRDGGYVNDWRFGENAIRGFCKKIAQTGVEIFEIGFIKGDTYDSDRAVFPNIEPIENVISPKADGLMYVAMLDMSTPIPIEKLSPRSDRTVDGLRVIFKKDKLNEAYDYCADIQKLGYTLFVQFVGTDSYSDKEFIEAIEKFNALKPYAVSIVDSFGLIKRKQFLRLVYLADNNLGNDIILGYHAHNNLQQAFGNAEALVDLGLRRNLCIDACIFGMGRGAGNLNMELFAEYLNENHGTNYRIEPMLEIMDEYLAEIYKEKFWGYSLPLYLSATTGCHPDYAIYLAEKDSLTVKAFNELLRGIPKSDKSKFSTAKAEKYYREYLENFIDDKQTIIDLSEKFEGRDVLMLAPGRSLIDCKAKISETVNSESVSVISVNFINPLFQSDFVFSSNMRRYSKIQGKTDAECIITSNMKDAETYKYVVNFASYASESSDIIDNSGLMALKLLMALGIKRVLIAGMDGYLSDSRSVYFNSQLEFDFSTEADTRNTLIGAEIAALSKNMDIRFITPSIYER